VTTRAYGKPKDIKLTKRKYGTSRQPVISFSPDGIVGGIPGERYNDSTKKDQPQMKKSFLIILTLVFIASTAMSFFLLSRTGLSQNDELKLEAIAKSDLAPVQKELELSAWAPWWEEERVLESLRAAQGKLKIISPVWYHLDQRGRLFEIESKLKLEITELAKEHRVLILPTISNAYSGGFDPQRVSIFLESENLKEAFIADLIETAQIKGYDGWDIDWEEVREADKDLYSQFLRELGVQFKPLGLKLSAAVHAQTGAETDWVGVRGQDLKSIAEAVDYVRVMAYDFHYADSVPGPITPLDKMIEVIKYKLTIIPAEKLVLGLPTYGYNWGSTRGIPLQFYQINQIAVQRGITPVLAEEPYSMQLSYLDNGVSHEIWYEDSQTLNKKIEIARSYGIYQVCLWHIGGEDLGIWDSN
jgi:spore germination protein